MATISSFRQPSRTLSSSLARGLPARLLGRVALWLQHARERRQLQELDDHALADLGLSRDQVMREVDKYFWQR